MKIKLFALTLLSSSLLLFSACSSDTLQATPNFKVSEISGKTITQTDIAGKVTVINFWATSCVTCVKEMPQLVSTYEKFKPQGLEFIALAMSYDPHVCGQLCRNQKVAIYGGDGF